MLKKVIAHWFMLLTKNDEMVRIDQYTCRDRETVKFCERIQVSIGLSNLF